MQCRKTKGGWGGKRSGAGRKRQLKIEDSKQIANDYFRRMQDRRELALQNKPPRRELVIKELMGEYGLSKRMAQRVIAEFLPKIRENAHIWDYATEGMNDDVQPLPKRKFEKLKPGVYADSKVRLIVDPAGNRKWIFRFIWRSRVRDMVLGGSELSLAVARERATKASRMVAEGQNPIDGSWLSPALQKVKSKS